MTHNGTMLLRSVLFAAAMALAIGARADAYPSRTVRLVVPYPAGGGADTVARLVAQKMSVSVGQQVIVDNRPGAGEVTATELVARAVPDGYTLLVTTNSFAINAALGEKLPYDPVHDFALASRIVTMPLLLVVN